jgi:hypothetical protein
MRIGNIPDIQNFKQLLNHCKEKGLITDWELPYEQLLTRLSAAIFFFNVGSDAVPDELYTLFAKYPGLVIHRNEGTMSLMSHQISFQ